MSSLISRLKNLEDFAGEETVNRRAKLLDPETKEIAFRNYIRSLASDMIRDECAMAEFLRAYGIREECSVAFFLDATPEELLAIGKDTSDVVRELLECGITREFIREGYPGELDRKPVQPYVPCSTPRFSSWESRHPATFD
jgi:hypothetical protein